MRVVAGPREADETLWTLKLPDGGRIELDHDMADSISIRLDETTT